MPSDMLDPAFAAKAEAEFNMTPARGPYTLAMSSTALYISLPNITASYIDIVNKMRDTIEDGSSSSYLPANSDPTLIAGYKRQLSVLAAFYSNPEAPSVEVPFATGTAMRPIILHPLSRGTVHLNLTDHLAQPLLDYRAGTNPIDFDINIAHLRWLRKVIDTPTLQKYGAVEVTPGLSIRSDEDLKAYVKESMVLSHMHPCCTAAMMPKSLGGVVGPDLKVHGAAGLRVVDISILPFLPSAHTSSTAYTVGEKVSAL
jgi:choline dehydrogenase